jgi:hypothetical protein
MTFSSSSVRQISEFLAPNRLPRRVARCPRNGVVPRKGTYHAPAPLPAYQLPIPSGF